MISADRDWHRFEGASSEVLSELRRLGRGYLPEEYLRLLSFSDGGEGPLAVQPFNLCLDSAEEVIRNLNERAFDSLFPGFLVFGGNGGGELLAFDTREQKPWPVVALDSTNINLEESVIKVAENFSHFLEFVGIEAEDV